MIDLVTIIIVAAAGLAFSYVMRYKNAKSPNLTEGPPDHIDMPEVKYIYPLEAGELNASCYGGPGRSFQVGAFGLK